MLLVVAFSFFTEHRSRKPLPSQNLTGTPAAVLQQFRNLESTGSRMTCRVSVKCDMDCAIATRSFVLSWKTMQKKAGISAKLLPRVKH